jgi:hypothetical protein
MLLEPNVDVVAAAMDADIRDAQAAHADATTAVAGGRS